MAYLQRNWSRLKTSEPLLAVLRQTSFVECCGGDPTPTPTTTTTSGVRKRAGELYDPSHPLLARVFCGQPVGENPPSTRTPDVPYEGAWETWVGCEWRWCDTAGDELCCAACNGGVTCNRLAIVVTDEGLGLGLGLGLVRDESSRRAVETRLRPTGTDGAEPWMDVK